MKIITFLIIYVMFLDFGDTQNFSFPDIMKQLTDALLTPRKYMERKKIILKKDKAEEILRNLTAERNRRLELTHSTMIDPDLLHSQLKWPQENIKISSRRVYPKSTTEAFELKVEKSEENEETDKTVVSDSDDYEYR